MGPICVCILPFVVRNPITGFFLQGMKNQMKCGISARSARLGSAVGNESDCRSRDRGFKFGPIRSWRLIMK